MLWGGGEGVHTESCSCREVFDVPSSGVYSEVGSAEKGFASRFPFLSGKSAMGREGARTEFCVSVFSSQQSLSPPPLEVIICQKAPVQGTGTVTSPAHSFGLRSGGSPKWAKKKKVMPMEMIRCLCR